MDNFIHVQSIFNNLLQSLDMNILYTIDNITIHENYELKGYAPVIQYSCK